METDMRQIAAGELETEYVQGNATDFVLFIQNLKEKAVLCSVDGHFRWVVKRDDGTEYICRPQETEPNEQ